MGNGDPSRASEQARRWHPAAVLVPVALVALWGAFLVAVATRHGIHVTPDSATYFGVADNLRLGRGPTVPFTFVWDRYSVSTAIGFHGRVPLTHFPPGYPIALAIVSLVSGSARSAARLLGIGCIAANLFLAGLLAARLSGFRSIIVALLPPFMLLYVADTRFFLFEGPGWIFGHETAWSEPLFALCFTGALIVAGIAIESNRTRRRAALGCVSALLGAALFTRYVGVAGVVAVVGALVVLDRRGTLLRRSRRAAIVGLAAIAPLLVYLVAAEISGAGGARPLSYHPQPGSIRPTFANLGRALFPLLWSDRALAIGVVVVSALVVVGLVWPRCGSSRNGQSDEGATLLWLAFAAVLSYVGVALVSRTFFDRALVIDPRLFIGVRAIWTAAVVAGLYRLLSGVARPWFGAVALAVLMAIVVHADWPTQKSWLRPVPQSHPTAIERMLTRLPRGALIVGNSPDVVYLSSQRPSLLLPARNVYVTGEPNSAYDREVKDFTRRLRAHGAYAFFTVRPDPILTAEELGRRVRMKLIASGHDQQLFEIVPVQSRPHAAGTLGARERAAAQSKAR